LGLEKNEAEAIKFFRQAAAQGHCQALAKLGSIFLQERPNESSENSENSNRTAEGLSLLKQAAEKGDQSAVIALSAVYRDGTKVPQDKEESARWIRVLADWGDPSAQYELGRRYYKGDGLKEDKAEAAKWYGLAASKGEYVAQFLLAKMHLTGDGLEKDLAKAADLFKMARVSGIAQADLYCGLLENDLIGLNPASDPAEGNTVGTGELLTAKIELRKRADKGEARAQLYLGLMALTSFGGPPDKAEALKWLKLAADQDLASAQFHLAQM
jgi:TPR repeat protein